MMKRIDELKRGDQVTFGEGCEWLTVGLRAGVPNRPRKFRIDFTDGSSVVFSGDRMIHTRE